MATDLLQQILVTFTGDMAEREIKEMMTVMKRDKEGKKDYVYVYVGNYRGVCCSANLDRVYSKLRPLLGQEINAAARHRPILIFFQSQKSQQ